MQDKFEMGKLAVTVEKDDSMPTPVVEVHYHPRDEEELEATVEALGGLAAFDPIDPRWGWIRSRLAGDDGTSLEVSVYVPDRMQRPEPKPKEGMAELRERQDEALAVTEAL